mgnify:CR=1 FL=1
MVMKFNLLNSSTLPTYLIAIIIAGCLIVVAVLVFLVIFFGKRKKNSIVDASAWLNALGGKENIANVSEIGSRINLSLKDKEKIDREKLTSLGVNSVLVMSNKVTLVINNAVDVAETISNGIKD